MTSRRDSGFTQRVEGPRDPMIDIHIRISRKFVYAVVTCFVGLFLLSWVFGMFGTSSGGIDVAAVQKVRGIPASSSVWSIKTGMTRAEVLARLGPPLHRATLGRGNPQLCWSYPASRPNTGVTARTFCFRRDRVARILTRYHG